ncbi:MAG: Rho termination factor N-terminal domain-containing protein [Elainellaceae cyanobacterium]
MSDNYDEKYTRPDLRRELKEEIKQSDKGGKPGQWSARKSQLLVQKYEEAGGGYKKDEKDEAARSLEEWTEQNWQTRDGSTARQGEMTKRYLPEAVWERLSEDEKKEANATKKDGSEDGEQYVDWTPAIKRAMKEAGYINDDDSDNSGLAEQTKQELYERAKAEEISGRSKMDKDELINALKQQDEASDDCEQSQTPLTSHTKADLYEKAQDLEISGRSKMDKQELIDSIRDEMSD